MHDITFNNIKSAWEKLKSNRLSDMQKVAPNLATPDAIYIKRLSENDVEIAIQFAGFTKSVTDLSSVPQIKRMIVNWLKNVSVSVQQVRSDDDTLIMRISKELKMSEAAISVYKRDPKTNKRKTQYKCIGGKKDGRKVATPDACIGVPDPEKKIKFSVTKRAKYGQAAKSRKKTQLTNVTARRIRKANQRLKKARGF
jgi:hypothetical protein